MSREARLASWLGGGRGRGGLHLDLCGGDIRVRTQGLGRVGKICEWRQDGVVVMMGKHKLDKNLKKK